MWYLQLETKSLIMFSICVKIMLRIVSIVFLPDYRLELPDFFQILVAFYWIPNYAFLPQFNLASNNWDLYGPAQKTNTLYVSID